jgi:hypothetical protein
MESRRKSRETRYMVTGNILAGYDQVQGTGQIVNYTTESGELKPGILMARGFKLGKFIAGPPYAIAQGTRLVRDRGDR